MKEKQIVMLDASALANSSCLLKLHYLIVDGYRDPLTDSTIEFGTAFHKFVAHWKRTNNFGEALLIASSHFTNTPMMVKHNKKYLDVGFLQQACLGYASKYAKDDFEILISNGEHLIELPFCFPFYVDEDIELLLAGTIDAIGKMNSAPIIKDIKTTGSWSIPEKMKSYKLSPQMLFYRWAIQKYAEEKPDSIIGEINRQGVDIIIDGVFYKGADKPIEFVRSDIISFKESTIKEFEVMLQRKVLELVHFIKAKQRPLREGMLNGSCYGYSVCPYFGACSTIDLETREMVLDGQFKKSFYNPLEWQK